MQRPLQLNKSLKMPEPIVTIIRHHANEVEMTDTAIRFFDRNGIRYRYSHHYAGDKLDTASGVTPTIVLGGSQNVTELEQFPYLSDELKWIECCLQQDLPIVGICLGAQLMAHALGAKVSAREPRECEFGFYEVTPTADAVNWLNAPQYFMQAHLQEFELPDRAVRLAGSESFPQQAFRYGKNAFALQFHPEVDQIILDNWHADSWSDVMVKAPGAQSFELQQQLAATHLPLQVQWFNKFLESLFTPETVGRQ